MSGTQYKPGDLVEVTFKPIEWPCPGCGGLVGEENPLNGTTETGFIAGSAFGMWVRCDCGAREALPFGWWLVEIPNLKGLQQPVPITHMRPLTAMPEGVL